MAGFTPALEEFVPAVLCNPGLYGGLTPPKTPSQLQLQLMLNIEGYVKYYVIIM